MRVTAAEAWALMRAGVTLIDTRPLPAFLPAHVPGALPVEFNLADLTDRAALLLPSGTEVLVVAEPEATIAASLGLLEDAGLRVHGHLAGGVAAWAAAGRPLRALPTLTAQELHAQAAAHRVLDVREPFEFKHGHLAAACLLPSGEAWAAVPALARAGEGGLCPAPDAPDADRRPFAVFCSGSGRAAFVAALLQREGAEARLVLGGMYAWQGAGLPVVREA